MSRPCSWRRLLSCILLGALSCVLSTGLGLAQEPRCTNNSDPPACRAILAVLRLNGTLTDALGDVAVILYEDDETIYAARADLVALHLRDGETIAFSKHGRQYIALRSRPGLTYQHSSETQELNLKVLPEAFAGSSIDLNNPTQSASPVSSSIGAFLNYDVFVQSASRSSFGALGEIGQYSKAGFASTRFARGLYGAGLVRLESTFIHDFPNRRESLRIGDSLTNPGGWGRTLYFGGVQWGTDSTTQPSLVTFPQSTIRGEAVLPSVAELYVNQSLRWSQQVPAGPFEIRNPPLPSGPGQFTLVVRDVLGRDTSMSASYFASPRLLKPGLAEYSISAGLGRNSLGSRSFAYGRGIATGSYRRGLSNRFTAEVRSEFTSSLRATGVSLIAMVFPHVLVSANLVKSQSVRQGGLLKGGTIEFQTRRLTAGAQVNFADSGFRQLGLDRTILPQRKQMAGSMGFNMFRRDRVSLAYYRQEGTQPIRYASTSYSVTLTRRLNWNITANRSLDQRRELIVFSGLTFQLSDTANVSHSVLRNNQGTEAQVAVQKNLPLGEGSGYRVSGASGPNARADGTYTLRTATTEIQLQGTSIRGNTGLRAEVQGAIAFMRGGPFFTRRIDDGFAVVKVGNYSDIPVFFDHQEIARTNSKGLALVPRLLSYQDNLLSIDPERLPLNVALGHMETRVRPSRRSGVRLDFSVKEEQSVYLRVVDTNGVPIASQTRVIVEGLDLETTIGPNGILYLDDIKVPRIQLLVKSAGGACKVEWKREPNWKPGILEGPYECAP
jgi:outer membrane usher protein